jgi:hypothetical protein
MFAMQVQATATVVYRLVSATEAPAAVGATPRIDIGVSGAAAELFNRIAVVRWQSGNIVVANAAPPELRVFDANGRRVRTIGRKGAGPGEYEDINDFSVRRGDSLVVLDRRQRRLTFLAPDGAVASTIGFSPPFATPPYNVTINPLDDGTLLIGYALATTTRPSPQPVSVNLIVGRYATTGARLDSLGAFFMGENFLQAAPPNMGGFAFWDRAFGRRGSIVSTGNAFIAGDASSMEVRRYSRTGALTEVHRVDIPRKPVTAADISRYRTAALAGQTSQRDVAEKRVSEMPYPAHFPAYQRVIVDARGRIWLQEYQYPATGNRWIVLDATSRQARTVQLPSRFMPHEISATEVLGVWRDDDDVEHVRVYQLVL